MQCMGDLRTGVKLKKVNLTKTPIEFELTPYEILMDDIRTRNYKLRKVEAHMEGKGDGAKVCMTDVMEKYNMFSEETLLIININIANLFPRQRE